MNKKKSLLLSIIIVLVLGLIISTGTFAYFQWQAATGTEVNVTIEMGGIKMHIEPEATGFVGLYPTAHCENNVRYGDTLVRIENNTGALAIPSFKLKVLINPSTLDTGKLNYYKEHVHYAVVALETNKDGSKKLSNGNVITVGGNTIDELVTGTCSAPLNVSNTTDNDNTFKSDYGKTATGLFDVITAENTFADTPFLPREYNSTTGKVQGVTFRGEAYSTSYQWYRVYVWIDENYTTTIIGNDVTDPLQNAQIQITWSENSMLQQVSGESNVDTELEPGSYDEDGNMVFTWQQLIDNEDITVEDNVITSSSMMISGKLVIPEGIGGIGESAFFGAVLTGVSIPANVTSIGDYAFDSNNFGDNLTFAPGSQLVEIGDYAFFSSGITSIEIPANVTTIGDRAFAYNSSLSNIVFNGTVLEWNAIEFGSEWNDNVPATKVICSDGEVSLVS